MVSEAQSNRYKDHSGCRHGCGEARQNMQDILGYTGIFDLCLNIKGRFLICSKKRVNDVTRVLFGKTLLTGYCAVGRKRREMGAHTGLLLRLRE